MENVPVTPVAAETGRYRSVLRSTSLIGGASLINILIGMVKTKFVAILLGPTGVGLMGMLVQIAGLVTTVSGMGLSSSGVRQVAEAVGTGDDERIARTVKTLRHTVWLTGAAGMLVMILACVPISLISFDTTDYALPIAFLGITILLAAVTSGQACILQGTRRIADLAKVSVIGAANGTLISIPCFYLWGEQGIVVSLILCAVASLVTSWWFARRVPIKDVTLPWRASVGEARQMFSLGVGIMGAGLVSALSLYVIRVILLRQFDLDGVGIYQAAFALSGILVGFVLSAMGTDYYPRLTAVAHDNHQVRRMVNEQSEISILLALPLLMGMMVFAPLIIQLFYADTFVSAVPILRWCLLGALGRVLSWPLGYVILAKGKGRLFFVTETLGVGVHVVAVYWLALPFGLNGAGMAFLTMYVFYTVLMLWVAHRLIGATWQPGMMKLAFGAIFVLGAMMYGGSLDLNVLVRWGLDLAVLLIVSVYCVRELSTRSGVGLKEFYAKIGMK